MVHLIIGAIAMAGLLLIIEYSRKHALHLNWWQWGVTLSGFLYAVFVLEVIVSFLGEDLARGALVMGTLLGFVAVIWGVLLARFVFVVEGEQVKEAGDV
ncbi:hypothetical protein ACFL3H_02180 [Gemmatimonadota bacterium]